MPQETSMLDQLDSVMRKLLVYVKLANYDNIRNRLIEILNSDDEKRVFEATDGNSSTRHIEATTGVDKNVISRWWNEWQKEGIVEESQKAQGRRCRVLSLADFGIEVPRGKRQSVKKQTAQKDL